MNVPGLGEVAKDDRFGWHYSQPIKVAMLDGKECRIVLEGYDEEPNKNDYHVAISKFLSSSASVMKEAEAYIYQYYQDTSSFFSPSDQEFVAIDSPSEIWAHIQLGSEPIVSRRGYGDGKIYISLECNCDWEREHGLQIVFKGGNKVCKVGPYDGHLTNSDAFADRALENVVYVHLA